MTFGEAKARLILHAVGLNDYENITTWEELEDKAGFERDEANAKAQWLDDIAKIAQREIEDLSDNGSKGE